MDDDWVEVASGTESQAPGPSVEAPGNSPAKFPGPPAEAPGDPKETAPRPSRHITIGIFSDATASLASHVNRLKSVAKAIFAIVQGMKAAGDDGLVVHIVMAAMRDWCDAAHVFRVYTEEKASIRAGAILPMAYTGAAGQDEHLLRTLDAMASDCQGGGELIGDHPQFAIFVADDAHHGLTDSPDGASSPRLISDNLGEWRAARRAGPPPSEPESLSSWPACRRGALVTETQREDGEAARRPVFAVWCAVGNAAASDVPTQIATLICQHVKGRELPRVDCIRLGGGSLEQALKARAAEDRLRAEPLSRVPSAEMRQQRIAATITRQRSM
ncbi:hypothetical protein EMIHUDRAFT_95043 [Emiliania huxleyi CCMP1516]|uniref:VWFA domain-containing protein n=2 Tax=Emiliania huxleyi TaxID=2903 RepID=A0A0D3L1D9_EMIH1|nr:hypothetical protein EMIHUDRAFT_95043 [Emiliania huxleyi CCMP1516]EOD41824.1 hypothetical protein EMIHUDRAFT_95043 [Emiliania huxleyi CCMP1516]|eukprot:XP_005794253.1 hypothetical protein EMIHUDRAFT_95043 [Emiliania huxleyi CCMP1516]